MSMKIIILVGVIISNKVDYIDAHGRLFDPVARSSAWRKDSSFPKYYNDMEMYCGGPGVQWNQNDGKCGICGESYSATKLFEKGGIYYTGKIVQTYIKAQIIDVHIELTANHLGWSEFRICNVDNMLTDATQDCLDKTLLRDVNGLTRFSVLMGHRDIYYKIVLPRDLSCNHCVFQWKYNTTNTFGKTVEQFYGCSDIRIIESNKNETIAIISNATIPSSTTVSSTIRINSTLLDKTTKLQQNSTKLADENKLCINGDGYYADFKSGCKKFYSCSYANTKFEEITYFECPQKLLYDPKLKLCNYENQVKCNLD